MSRRCGMSTSLVLEPPSSVHSVKSFAANFSAISPIAISALVSRRSSSSGGSPETGGLPQRDDRFCGFIRFLQAARKPKMSLRWIHENLEAPTCDEECSDIDDSSDDSYDTELSLQEDDDVMENGKKIARGIRKKRETRRPPTTTVTFDGNGTPRNVERNSKLRKYTPYVIWDPRQPAKNPVYNCRIIKLYCRTGYHLAITPSGRVRGLSGNKESHALLHVTPVSFGVIRIQSIETRLYLAFDKKGRLYGEVNMTNDNTEWEQWSIGSYDAFRSRKYVHYGWWVGIKKNGRAKPGPKTSWGQKAIQFSAIQED